MQKFLLGTLIMIGLFYSCANKPTNTEKKLTVKGKIKGLRLGNLLLKKIDYDSIVSIDSIKVDGNENFIFQTQLDQPQMIILELPEIKDGQISFFAAPHDTIEVYTSLENFAINPQIKGGFLQKKWSEYKKMMQKFNDKHLDLLQEKFLAAKENKMKKADSLAQVDSKYIKKRKLYQLNFAFNNKDFPVGAYVGFISFHDNPKALDTIYKTLPQKMKQSKYGKWIKNILSN